MIVAAELDERRIISVNIFSVAGSISSFPSWAFWKAPSRIAIFGRLAAVGVDRRHSWIVWLGDVDQRHRDLVVSSVTGEPDIANLFL
jgi:hypothetical protein